MPARRVLLTFNVRTCFVPDLLRHITRTVTVLLLTRRTLTTFGLRALHICFAFVSAALRALGVLSGAGESATGAVGGAVGGTGAGAAFAGTSAGH